jgi:hypothetical protein
MRQFALRGIETLKGERDNINDPNVFEAVYGKYYEFSSKYCLN